MTHLVNTLAELREALHAHVVQVEFTKADGSSRVMRATLSAEHLPSRTHQAQTNVPQNDVFKVWDVDKQAWRSFRTHRLTSWKLAHVVDHT